MRSLSLLILLVCALALPLRAEPLALSSSPTAGDFPLVRDGAAAALVVEDSIDPAVARAATDLSSDIDRVSGRRPTTLGELPTSARAIVLVGVAGHSPALARLAAAGKIDLAPLAGAWERFVIQVVAHPFPGIDQALIVAGSDRRGAIFGLYELSSTIGVSPWYWWADVPPPHRDTLVLGAGTHYFGPPSVRYRGIFLNDEDWGLQPWAAKTFEPETGDIGPKTYAKLFELLLRLKANTLWPAMHACTSPFNADPANARLAEAYGIVMGSSHAEPMLRNNVREWTAPKEDYNYIANRDGVLDYWQQRVATNARYESIFTLGMRGIHDSAMVGPTTDAERVATLAQIFADQRALLAKHVRPEVEQVPQIFCAYKEVLSLYRQGLRVPDDVTIVWPDDNFGYIRNFATPAERTRAGGFGIYYHLSYLGRPLSYLWLSTTPPPLIWEEMRKAYEHGADRLWIANVGDLKPAEIGTEFFLQLGWDINRWRPDNLAGFLQEWSARNFSPAHAAEIAALLTVYYQLNFARKPEHLQWGLPKQPFQPSPFTAAEVQARLEAFATLRCRTEALRAHIPAEQQDAFYQLVFYPIIGSALANERTFEGERGNLAAARAANARLVTETHYFNEELSGGKWRGIMALEPADGQWSSMRIAPWTPPPEDQRPPGSDAHRAFRSPPSKPPPIAALDGAAFTANSPDGSGAEWTAIPGLGRSGRAVTVLPFTAARRDLENTASAPRLDYTLPFPTAGEYRLRLHLLPTHPLAGTALRVAVALDDQAPQPVSLEIGDGGPNWAQGVLAGERLVSIPLRVPASGPHTVHLWALDPGVVVDQFTLEPATAKSDH